ncbi:MAG: response regulator [Pseudomonadales bacterium]
MRYSILIIDDNEVDRYLLKRMLKNTTLDIVTFEKENGAEALEFLRDYVANRKRYPDDFPPLLLFLDINMPIMNGWEFLAEFAKLRVTIDLNSSTIVMLSSSNSEADYEKAKQFDFVANYIVKGQHTTDELVNTITSVGS